MFSISPLNFSLFVLVLFSWIVTYFICVSSGTPSFKQLFSILCPSPHGSPTALGFIAGCVWYVFDGVVSPGFSASPVALTGARWRNPSCLPHFVDWLQKERPLHARGARRVLLWLQACVGASCPTCSQSVVFGVTSCMVLARQQGLWRCVGSQAAPQVQRWQTGAGVGPEVSGASQVHDWIAGCPASVSRGQAHRGHVWWSRLAPMVVARASCRHVRGLWALCQTGVAVAALTGVLVVGPGTGTQERSWARGQGWGLPSFWLLVSSTQRAAQAVGRADPGEQGCWGHVADGDSPAYLLHF